MNVTHAANDLPLPSLVLEELKKSGLTPQRLTEAQVFCQAFFARIAASDVELHTPEQWTALIGGLLLFMQQRQPDTALVRVLNPTDSHAGRSLLQIVTDDMPFLVDTVSMIVSTKLQIGLDYHILREHRILTSMNYLSMAIQLILVLCQKKDFWNVQEHWKRLVVFSITD